MNRIERHIMIGDKNLDNLCFLSKNLYNYCNFLIRQEFINNRKMLSEYELTTQLAEEKQTDYIALPAQTSQQVIKLLFKNWKSFFNGIKNDKLFIKIMNNTALSTVPIMMYLQSQQPNKTK